MPNIEKLIPRIKVSEIPKNAAIEVDDGEWKIKIIRPSEDPVITIEYIGEKPRWGLIKLEAPKPDMDLQDLVTAAATWLKNLIEY